MKRCTALSFALLVAVVGGCEQGSRGKGTIGVSVLTLTNPFFKVIADNIRDEAAKHGFDVIVVSGENDVARQQKQVEDFLVKGVDAIVLCPCDARSIGPVIQRANAEGVPVFTADLACLDPKAKVVCHVATDNYGGGKQAGEAMIEALGPVGGKVAILHFKQAESCLLRVQGFREVIEAYNRLGKGGRIHIVGEFPGDGHKDKGYNATEDVLQTHGDLAGIFAINDPSALGARAALEKAKRAEQVKLIGFDGQPDGKQAIKAGKIYADPVQFPDKIGALTVRAIMRYLDGEEVPPQELIPTALYRQADGLRDPSLK